MKVSKTDVSSEILVLGKRKIFETTSKYCARIEKEG